MIDFNTFPSSGLQGVYRDRILTVDQLYERITNLNRYIDMMKKDIEKIRNKQNYYNLFINDSNLDTVSSKIIDSKQYEYKDYPKILKNSTFYFDTIRSKITSSGSEEVSITTEYGKYEKFRNPLMNIYDSTLSGFNYNFLRPSVPSSFLIGFGSERKSEMIDKNFIVEKIVNGSGSELTSVNNSGDVKYPVVRTMMTNLQFPTSIEESSLKDSDRVDYNFIPDRDDALLEGHFEQENNVRVLLSNDFLQFPRSTNVPSSDPVVISNVFSNKSTTTGVNFKCEKNLSSVSNEVKNETVYYSKYRRDLSIFLNDGSFVFYNKKENKIVVAIQTVTVGNTTSSSVDIKHESFIIYPSTYFNYNNEKGLKTYYSTDAFDEGYGPIPKLYLDATVHEDKIYIVLTKSLDRISGLRGSEDSKIFATSQYNLFIFDKNEKKFIPSGDNLAKPTFARRGGMLSSLCRIYSPNVVKNIYFLYPVYNVEFGEHIRSVKYYKEMSILKIYSFHKNMRSVPYMFNNYNTESPLPYFSYNVEEKYKLSGIKNIVGSPSSSYSTPSYERMSLTPDNNLNLEWNHVIGLSKPYWYNENGNYNTNGVYNINKGLIITDVLYNAYLLEDFENQYDINLDDTSFFGKPANTFRFGILSHFIVAKDLSEAGEIFSNPDAEMVSDTKFSIGSNIDLHRFYFQRTGYQHKGKIVNDRMYYFYISDGKLNVTTTWMMSSSDEYSGYDCVVPLGVECQTSTDINSALNSFYDNYDREIEIIEPTEDVASNLGIPYPCILFTLDTKFIYYIKNIDSTYDKINELVIGFKEIIPGSNTKFRMFNCLNDIIFVPVTVGDTFVNGDSTLGLRSGRFCEYEINSEEIDPEKGVNISYYSAKHGLRTFDFGNTMLNQQIIRDGDERYEYPSQLPTYVTKYYLMYNWEHQCELAVTLYCFTKFMYSGATKDKKEFHKIKTIVTTDGNIWNSKEFPLGILNIDWNWGKLYSNKLSFPFTDNETDNYEFVSPRSIFSVSTEVKVKFPESIIPDGSLQPFEGNTFHYPSYFCEQDKSFLFITDFEEFIDPVIVSSSVPYAVGADYTPPKHSLAIVFFGKLRTPIIPFAFYDMDVIWCDNPTDYKVDCIVDVYVPSDLVWYYEKNKDDLFLKYNDRQNMTINIFDIRLFKQKDFGKLIEECEFKTPLSENSFHTSIAPPDTMTIKEGSTITLNFGGSGDAKVKIARLYKNLLNATDLCKSIWNIFSDYGNIVMYEDKFNEFFEVSRDEFTSDPGRFVFVVRIPANSGEFPDHGDVPDDSYLWVVIRDKSGKPIEAVFDSEDSVYRVDGAFDIFKSGGNFYSQEIDAEDVYVVDTKIVGKTDIVTDKICSHEEPLTVYFTPYGDTSKIKYNMERYASSDLKGLTYITGGKVEILVNGNRFGTRSLTTIGPDISDLRTSDVFTELDMSTGENIKYRPYQDMKHFQTRLRFEEDTKRVQLFPLFENYLDKKNDIYVSDASKSLFYLLTESYSPFVLTLYDKLNGYAKIKVDPSKQIVTPIEISSDSLDITVCFVDKNELIDRGKLVDSSYISIQKNRKVPFFITIDRKNVSQSSPEGTNWDMFIDITNENNFKFGIHTMNSIVCDGNNIEPNILVTTMCMENDYFNAEFNYKRVPQTKHFIEYSKSVGDQGNKCVMIYKKEPNIYTSVKVEK